jgi:hypothetical protein
MFQKGISKQPFREPDIAKEFQTWIAALLYHSNHTIVSDQVVFDEEPIEETEIRESLLDGRIAYSRTDPPIHRLKHVWRAKGHDQSDAEKTVELLIGQFRWISGYRILAQRVNGEWGWIGG